LESPRIEREMLRIRREAPAGVVLETGADAAALEPEQIQAALAPNVTVAEYYKVNDQLVAALITRDRLDLEVLGPVSAIEPAMAALRFQMGKLRLGPDYVKTFEDSLLRAAQHRLLELYQHVIAPVRKHLKTPHLVVAPQGSLHHLPFHALFDGSRYLIDDFTVTYSPSASIYALCEARPTVTLHQSLIVGVPDPAIPLIEDEVASVAAAIPGAKLIIGADATCETLINEGASSRVIHIATHGRFREDQPMFSGIRMADAWLSVCDLMQLRLPAELITLSGCSTGLNVVSAGDEIMGLARGLIRAGAQSALLSLWDVQDRSTTEFMKTLYSTLAAGVGRAEAVREAAIRLRESHRHPYYWAPFFLVGKGFSGSRPKV